MAKSPLLGGDRAPQRAPGTGTDRLGPSDTSDSGSDVVGADADLGDGGLDGDSDSHGTGERAQAGRDTVRRDAPDIAPDRVEGSDEAMEADEVGGLAGDDEEDDGGTESDRAVDA